MTESPDTVPPAASTPAAADSSSQTALALAVAVQAGLPVLLWGPPGGGKTSVVAAIAKALGWPIEIVIGAVHDAADFAGLPVRTDDGVSLTPPSWAKRLAAASGAGSAGRSPSADDEPGAVLLLDELTTAHPSVQAAMLQVVLERRVGDLQLPDTVRVVAAANPPQSAAGGSLLTAPLANRFVHLRWEPAGRDIAEGLSRRWPAPLVPRLDPGWREGLSGWCLRVGGFLLARPELAHRVPETADGQSGPWPSPRTWEMAAASLCAADAAGCGIDVANILVAGCVGDGPAAELGAWLASCALPDPDELLTAPATVPLPDRGDQVYATLGGLVAAVAGECTVARWHAAWIVLDRVATRDGLDVAAVAARHLLRLRQPGWELPDTLDRYADALSATGLAP